MPQYSQARPATLEEYDEINHRALPGTRVEARAGRTPIIQQPRPPNRTSSQSRVRSQTVAESAQLVISARSATPATTGPMVQINRSSSRAGYSQGLPPLQRSNTSNGRGQPQTCTDANCSDPSCLSARNTERRYVVRDHRPMPQPIQQSAPFPDYRQSSTQSQSILPNTRLPEPVARPRSTSYSSRPMSWAGAPAYTQSFIVPQTAAPGRGPPPSPSAYRNIGYQYPSYQAPMQTSVPYAMPLIYGSVPTEPQPVAPLFVPPRGQSRNEIYNTRAVEYPAPISPPSPRLARTNSNTGRLPNPRVMPGAFPDDEVFEEPYFPPSERYYDDRYSPPKRDSMMMMMPPPPPPPRRSSSTTSRPRIRMQSLSSRRDPPSDFSDDPLSDGYVESTSTLRPSDNRRHSSQFSSRTRQQSVSTNGSSSRTQATTVSSESRGDAYIIVEDARGRRRKQYVSAEDLARIKRFEAKQVSKQQRAVNEAEAYQSAVRGGEPDDLTAENIRSMFDKEPSPPQSQASGRSRRSGQTTQSDIIKILFNGTTMQVSGGASIEMSSGSDGQPRVVVNPGGARETPYHANTSRSSESRVGRSRGESIRDTSRRPHSIVESSGA